MREFCGYPPPMAIADAWGIAEMAILTGRAVPPSKWVETEVDAANDAAWDAFAPK